MAVVSDAVLARAAADVVPILPRMIGFDTTIAGHDDEPRDELAAVG
jgi:hypothetical protein